MFSPKSTINCRGELLDITQPLIMGILNLTPDSFFDGGFYQTEKKVLDRVEQILKEGGKIIDVGAVSTRPNAKKISSEEEIKRLKKFLNIIRKKFPEVILSLDTYHSEVAKKMVLDYEIDIINDISAGSIDDKMFEVIAELNVPYIMTHIQGTPQNMQKNPKYKKIVKEIILFFAEKLEKLNLLGINDIILDLGFGFGKTLEDNYKLLRELDSFKIFKLPILVGVSRKSMVYNALNITPEKALNGTSVLHSCALQKGANILRVHDVKEAIEVIKINELMNLN